MTPTKGAATRRRIVELAAPVFNRQGYAGASMRDLVEATGLEKGGIYNHFGSKEQLALEAFDYAFDQISQSIQRAQNSSQDAPTRLLGMITAFSTNARQPEVEGGCPIMNTAIDADGTNPELQARARAAMTEWHRLIGSIVKQGKAEGTLRADVDPYELASVITSSLEGGLMLARLNHDATRMNHVVDHLVHHVDTLRAPSPRPSSRRPRTEESQ